MYWKKCQMSRTDTFYKVIKTRWGSAYIIFNKNIIKKFILPDNNNKIIKYKLFKGRLKWLEKLERKVQDYFNGEKTEFNLKNIDLSFYSEFRQRIYRALSEVKYGKLINYRELSGKAGYNASRAVGNAMAENPIPLFIPCHRVIKLNGDTGHFSYGREYKKKMLKMEKSI